jgi:hypothetical protein
MGGVALPISGVCGRRRPANVDTVTVSQFNLTHISKIEVFASDSPSPERNRPMRRVAPIVLTTLALLASSSLGAVPGPDTGALARPLSPAIASPRTGVIQESPRVTTTQNGKVTEVTVAGQLAAKHPVGCVPLAQVDNTRTPPDLYVGVTACIQQDNYRAAVALFALAGMESHFDAERVLDKSAGQAGQVLIMGTFNGLSDEKRAKFAKTVSEFAADTAALAQTCSSIRKMGYPTYYPEYMVLHGIHAFTAQPGDPTLVATFDAAATWNSMLTTYLNCHDAVTPDAQGTR